MEIVYTLVFITLYILLILSKKNDKKENILFWGTLTLIGMICFNILESYIFSLIKLKSTLLNLTIVNAVISIVLLFIIIKTKKIQKYYIKIKDIVVFVILLMLVIGIAYKQYGFPLNVKYETTDPAIHFSAAKSFYNEQIISGEFMPGAYVNTGILFTIFSDYINEIDFHYIYTVFDLVMLYLIGIMFYIGVTNKENSITKSLIAFIATIIFILGYPLNSLIFGYQYLTLGILILTTIIAFAPYTRKNELNVVWMCIYLTLLTFGIFFTYYYFVPVVYASIGLYMLFDMIKNRKNKNIFSTITISNMLVLVITLIIPFIMGICFFLLPGIINSTGTPSSHLAAEGYCYRNMYSNFIFVIPFGLFYIIQKIKNKENDYANINMLLTIAFTGFLLIKVCRGSASTYYFYKIYFLISILLMYMFVKALYMLIDSKMKIFAWSYVLIYVSVLAWALFGIDAKVQSESFLLNPSQDSIHFCDIYMFNKQKIDGPCNIFTTKQLDAIKFIKEKNIDRKEITINGNLLQMMWGSNLGNITETDDMLVLQGKMDTEFDKWLENEERKYYVCFGELGEEVKQETDKYEILYENEEATILNKK